MSFDSFYGGRQGASFVIVKRFDGIDIPQSSTKTYKPVFLAGRMVNNSWCYIYDANDFIYQDETNYANYSWKMHALNGASVPTVPKTGTTVINRNLPTKEAEGMVQCFMQGGDTTNIVNYGEYVIIDTPSKEDPTNGKVYRRGMNYDYDADTNPLAGAEYIGQIVGPRGSTADIDIEKYSTVIAKSPHEAKTYTVSGKDLTPGANTARTSFDDDVNYAWANVRDSYGNIESYLIGFTFPYLVTDMSASWRKPYYEQGDVIPSGKAVGDIIPESANFELFVDNGWSSTDRDPTHGDTGHAFYRKWKISVPKGVKGDTQTNLEIYPTLVTEGSKIYPNVNTSTGQLSGTPTLAPANKKLNLTNYETTKAKGYVAVQGGGYVYLTDTRGLRMRYLETVYDNKEAGEKQFIDIGEYNTITNVTLSEDGWLTVFYSWDDPKVLEEALRWIKYDSNTGADGIQFNSDGTVTIIYNTLDAQGHNEKQTHPNLISWINSTTLGRNGHYKVIYNNNNSQISPKTGVESGKAVYETDLTWPTQVSLTPGGVLKFMYNNNLLNDIYPNPWTGPGTVDRVNGSYSFIIPWLDKVKLLRDGHFNFIFNNDELYDPTDPDWASKTLYAPRITWIDKVKLLADGHLNFKFNNNGLVDPTDSDWDASGELYSPRFTWIVKTSLDDNGQLRIYFNNDLNKNAVTAAGGTWIDGPDPEDLTQTAHYYNKQLLWVADVQIDNDGTIHFIYCDGTSEIVPSIKIKYLTNVQIETTDASGIEGTGDQRVHVDYNTGLSEVIGKPLNYIIDTVITGMKMAATDPPEYHLLVYYADPATRAKYAADPAYHTYTYYSPKLNRIVDDWVDLGYTKGEPGGIHIITNFQNASDLVDSTTGQNIKPEYINGATPGMPLPLPNADHMGWAVTVEDSSTTPSTYNIYFYDYDKDQWYTIGSIDSTLIDPRNIIITAPYDFDPSTPFPPDVYLLNTYGIWMTENERVYAQ